MAILKILLGLLALLFAWSYIFRSKLIFRINAWMRDHVFNDQVVLFSGRRVAILLFLLGAIALFSGLENLIKVQTLKPHIAAQIIETAKQDISNKRYRNAVLRCREIIKSNPESIEAWELLVDAYSRMGENELAKQGASVLLRLDPDHPVGRSAFNSELQKIKRERQ